MALSLRTGEFGEYWGDDYTSSHSLNLDQEKTNATYIYYYLTDKGWTKESIAGLLGNMQSESAINPGRWQSNNVGNLSGGYGLVQWTPATKYINWIGVNNNPESMDHNLSRIIYELEHGIQWIRTRKYNLTFKEFTQSTQSPYYLAMAFVNNYERPASISTQRGINAEFWYEYLGGVIPPRPKEYKEKRFPWAIYTRKLRKRINI